MCVMSIKTQFPEATCWNYESTGVDFWKEHVETES